MHTLQPLTRPICGGSAIQSPMPCYIASPATVLHSAARVDCPARPRVVAGLFCYARHLVCTSCTQFLHHGLGRQDRLHQATIAGNGHLATSWDARQRSSRHKLGCMEDQRPLCESIEVNTQFVKRYPHMHTVEGGWHGKVLATWTAVSQNLAGVEGISQAIADVVDGDHSQKDHQAWEERPVWRQIQIISGI
jgi:hypothetical protein